MTATVQAFDFGDPWETPRIIHEEPRRQPAYCPKCLTFFLLGDVRATEVFPSIVCGHCAPVIHGESEVSR